jgi:diguanylate cyclase (GGDEF)-like protein/PAS domain S-box-containing protein
VVTPAGDIQSSNPAFARLLGASTATSRKRLPDLLGEHRERVESMIRESLASGIGVEVDLPILSRETRQAIWIEMSLNPISANLLQGVVDDITARKHNEINALELATHDSLTGLLNRHGMLAAVNAAFSRPTPDTLPSVALLQIDLDYFKDVNDTYGHEAGDQVLCHVARILERTLRQGDVISRPGGDEFIAGLVGISARDKAEELANRLVSEISRPVDLGNGRTARIGASIGIAFATAEDASPEAVLRRADAAMYAAKQAGRGRAYLAGTDIASPVTAAA